MIKVLLRITLSLVVALSSYVVVVVETDARLAGIANGSAHIRFTTMYRCIQPDAMHAGYLGWCIFQHQFGTRSSRSSKQPSINTYKFLVIPVVVIYFFSAPLLLILKRNIKIVLWRPFVYWWKNARTNEVNVASLFAACTGIPAFHFQF